MNERIRELAEQAAHQSPDGYPVVMNYSKDYVQKFAELMVKECALVIQDLVDHRVPASEYPDRMIAHFAKIDHGD